MLHTIVSAQTKPCSISEVLRGGTTINTDAWPREGAPQCDLHQPGPTEREPQHLRFP
jgi:hypothetical protein